MTRMAALTLLLATCDASRFEVDTMAGSREQTGKAQLDELLRDTVGASCWGRALENLKAGCRQMDDVERSRLAVQVRASVLAVSFARRSRRLADALRLPKPTRRRPLSRVAQSANCHLEQSGLSTYECDDRSDSMDIAACTGPMVNRPLPASRTRLTPSSTRGGRRGSCQEARRRGSEEARRRGGEEAASR